MSEQNMFRDCGEAGFYANSYGVRTNVIIVRNKDTDIIYSKDSIPLGNKVYLADEKYIGIVESSNLIERPVGMIYEITMYGITELYKSTGCPVIESSLTN